MATGGWTEQWSRSERWYLDIEKTYDGRPGTDGGTDFLRDRALAFFVFAYHLADWIDHDPAVTDPKDKALDYARKDPALSWCRDICNATKHLTLNEKATAQDTKVAPAGDVELIMGEPGVRGSRLHAKHTFSVTATIDGVGERRDVMDLANDVMDAWRAYLGRRSLLPPTRSQPAH